MNWIRPASICNRTQGQTVSLSVHRRAILVSLSSRDRRCGYLQVSRWSAKKGLSKKLYLLTCAFQSPCLTGEFSRNPFAPHAGTPFPRSWYLKVASRTRIEALRCNNRRSGLHLPKFPVDRSTRRPSAKPLQAIGETSSCDQQAKYNGRAEQTHL
jgi:hypothetical protein